MNLSEIVRKFNHGGSERKAALKAATRVVGKLLFFVWALGALSQYCGLVVALLLGLHDTVTPQDFFATIKAGAIVNAFLALGVTSLIVVAFIVSHRSRTANGPVKN